VGGKKPILVHIRKRGQDSCFDCCEWDSPDNNNSNSGALSSCCGPPAVLASQDKQEEVVVFDPCCFNTMNVDQLSKWALKIGPRHSACSPSLIDCLARIAGQHPLSSNLLLGDQVGGSEYDDYYSDADAPPRVVPDHHGEKKQEQQERVELYSGKMRGLRELLVAERMNSSALQLQLTAQQSEVRRVKQQLQPTSAADLSQQQQQAEPAGRVKRLRRD
jgi:Menin